MPQPPGPRHVILIRIFLTVGPFVQIGIDFPRIISKNDFPAVRHIVPVRIPQEGMGGPTSGRHKGRRRPDKISDIGITLIRHNAPGIIFIKIHIPAELGAVLVIVQQIVIGIPAGYKSGERLAMPLGGIEAPVEIGTTI